MNPSLRTQETSGLFSTRLQRRIMMRVIPVLALSFLALVMIAALTVRNARLQTLREENARVLAEVNGDLQARFADAVEELTTVAQGPFMRQYAGLVDAQNRGESIDNVLYDTLRIQLLAEFDDLVGRNLQYFEAVRYVHGGDAIYLEVSNVGNETNITLATSAFSARPVDPPIELGGDLPLVAELRFEEDASSSRVTIMRPVIARGTSSNALALVQMTFTADYLADLVPAVLGNSINERSVILVDSANRPIFRVGDEDADVSNLIAAREGAVSVVNAGDGLRVSIAGFTGYSGATFPWRVVLVDDWSAAISEANMVTLGVAVLLLLIGLIVTALVALIMNRMLKPLAEVGEMAGKLAAGRDRGATAEVTAPGVVRDEIDYLAASVVGLSDKLSQLDRSLDAQTRQRNRDLEVAARIGREVATLYDIEVLLKRAINLICDEFGFYHAQVFLIDDAGINAVLAFSRGTVGEKLLARDYKMPVGSESVIGSVTANGRLVLVNDTQNREGMPYRPNPLLTETRAELGLPMMVGESVIGALDIQSKEPNVFRKEDLPVFSLLADQLAVAIFNARLLSQSDQRIVQIDRLNRELTQKAWADAGTRMQVNRSYRYNLLDVETSDTVGAAIPAALSSEIRIRNQVIGHLQAAANRGQEFTEGDEVLLRAVADRVALAIENARLFQETQVSLAETSVLYELSRALNDADTLEDILAAIIQTVLPEAASAQIWLFDEFFSGDIPDWMELNADLVIQARDGEPLAEKARLHLADYLFLSSLRGDQVTLVNDVTEDSRIDSDLGSMFLRLNARSLVAIPVAVRGVWRGEITLGFSEARSFSERDGRIFAALIDQAGVAIDNRLLLQQTEMEVARNENLYAASRIVNTAQNMADLVYSAVAITNDPSLEFRLSLLEGELDEGGWPLFARDVAESDKRSAREVDRLSQLYVPMNSPMRNRQPQVVLDTQPEQETTDRLILELRHQGYSFAAYFPLFNMQQPIAIFSILSKQPRDLEPSDYEVFRALTGQMSSQIQIRGLLESTEAALDETRRLYTASRAITSAQDLNAVYELMVDHMMHPLIQDQATGRVGAAENIDISLLFAQPEPVANAPFLEFVHVWSSDRDKPLKYRQGDQVSSEAYPFGLMTEAIGGAIYVPDLTRTGSAIVSQLDKRLRKLFDEQGARSLLIQPIVVRRQWFGVLICQSTRPNIFDEQYTRFVNALADQVAIAVDNQRLFDQARIEAERAQAEAQRALALAEAAQLASRIGDDFEKSLTEVFARVAEESGFDRWMLMMLDEGGNRLSKFTANVPGFDLSGDLSYTLDTSLPLVEAVALNQSITINNPYYYAASQTADETERQHMTRFFGKHVATPVRVGGQPAGSLFVGRSDESDDLNARDEQLVETLAVQVAIAIENRRLFDRVQREQENLRAILETLPAGVLVLDSQNLKPVQYNQQALRYFQNSIQPDVPFSIEGYQLYRTGTRLLYPHDEMSIFGVLEGRRQNVVDDVAIVVNDRQIDLQVAASPIHNASGEISYVVAVFQDISNLRSLENTLQENLQETVANLETQRQLAEADTLDDVLGVIVSQMAMMLQPDEAAVILRQDDGELVCNHFMNAGIADPALLRSVLRSEDVFVLNKLTSADISPDARSLLEEMNARSLITIPVRVGTRDKPVAWLLATSATVDLFDAESQRYITQLADMSSTAVDNRLLIQTQQQTVAEVRMLYMATNNISRSTGSFSNLRKVLRDTIGTLKPDYYAGYLASSAAEANEDGTLFSVAREGLEPLDFTSLMKDYEIPPWGFYISDLNSAEDLDDVQIALREAGLRSVSAVNLRPQDVAQGFVVIGYRDVHQFTDSEERFMNTVADSASIVFNNILLFEQTQAALEETSVLYQASKALSDATSPDDIINVIVDYLIAPHVNQVFIALLNTSRWGDAGALVQVAASWTGDEGVDLTGVTLARDQFPAWRQLATPDVLAISDIYEDESLDIMEQTGISSLDARSLVVVPLRVAKRDIGSIWIGSNEPYTYEDRDLRTFQAFAEQASLSLEASYLLEQTERRARQLETSAEVSRSASQILDLEVLLPQLVDLIKAAFQYDHVQIFLMDDYYEYAELRASTGEPGRQLLEIRHKLQRGSTSVIGQVTERGEPVIALDTAEAHVVHKPNPYLPMTRSEMALPLIVKGTVVGALDVQSNQPNAFTSEDVKALTTLAAQISVAIDNASLYEASQTQANRMSFMFEITSAAAAAETLDETVSAIAQSLHHNLGSLVTAIYLTRTYVDDLNNSFITLRAAALAGTGQPLDEVEEIRLDDETHTLARVGRSLRSTIIDNVAARDSYLPISAEAGSAVIVPLVVGQELIGQLVLEDTRVNAYDDETVQLLITLGGSLSAVLQSQKLLEQLQRTNEQLRELDRLKSDFLANMSHELRTPLNSIIGFSRIMLKGIDGPLTEMQEQDLTTIYTSGQHLLTLINDILDQAKIAANKLELNFAYFDIKQVVEAVRSIGIGLVKEKNLSIIAEIAPNLPKVYGDEMRTRQILINLVSNSAKFTQEGGINIRCYPFFSEQLGQHMVRVDVEDTGIGIAEKDMPLLFEAFRQVDSSLTRTQGGTGLGLPIAKSMTEMQGGEMTVASEVNKGSIFSITIPTEPVKGADDDDENAEGLDEDTGVIEVPTRPTMEVKAVTMPPIPQMMAKREVMLIEDNKDMVDQFRRVLQREGFEVVSADHPAYAEAMASNMRPTVIVMDVNFAGGQGWQILKNLKDRDDTFDIPIVVVSLSDESERAYAGGVYHFIQRPFDPEDLAAAVLEAEKESNTERILIIDDQPEDVRLLTQVLNDNGTYRVFSAGNGREGVSMVARRRPNLVILDLRMPEMDGFAVLQELRSNPETANIPVLIVTGEIDLNADERELLANVRVLHKTDISQEEYEAFIADVRSQLDVQ